jgi:hypothetical protein
LVNDRAGLAFAPGAVDGNIESTEARHDGIDACAHVILTAHISTKELRLRAELAQFGDKRVTGIVAPSGDGDASAFTRKSKGGCAADAGERTGDEDNW